MKDSNLQKPNPITITTEDNITLKGYYFSSEQAHKKTPILIAPAMGVFQDFYHPFAQWLTKLGHPVLTFNYRGMNSSHDIPYSLQHWGEQDIPAAIDSLKTYSKSNEIAIIGHSAGAQLLGLSHNISTVSWILMISASTGSTLTMSFNKKINLLFYQYIFCPLSLKLMGYIPNHWIQLGAPLSRLFGTQMLKWIKSPGYYLNDLGDSIKTHYSDTIHSPVELAYFTDDIILDESSVLDLLSLFPNAKKNHQRYSPDNNKKIGHSQFFLRKNADLWQMIHDNHISPMESASSLN